MTNIIYSTPIRSSLPQERWRREADAAAARRVAVAEAGRRREQAAIQLRQQMQNATATATAEQSLQAQFTALASQLVHQLDTMRDALVEFLVNENQELCADVQRLVKRARAEIEDSVERKTANFRPPTVRGTFDETEVYSQHDICAKNGGSFIARRAAAQAHHQNIYHHRTDPRRHRFASSNIFQREG
jgi:DNA replication initiation complex subunit (GINS family)